MNCANVIVADIQNYEFCQIAEAVVIQYSNHVFIQIKFSEVNKTLKNFFVTIFQSDFIIFEGYFINISEKVSGDIREVLSRLLTSDLLKKENDNN